MQHFQRHCPGQIWVVELPRQYNDMRDARHVRTVFGRTSLLHYFGTEIFR